MNERWKALSWTLRLLCIVPLATGTLDMVGGAWLLARSGAALPAAAVVDPILDSQIRFWGAMWLGYGASLVWVAAAPERRGAMLRILLGTLLLSGIARATSMVMYGSPGGVLGGAMMLELLAPLALLLWYGRLSAPEKGAPSTRSSGL